jgi:FG-GAP-like repeat
VDRLHLACFPLILASTMMLAQSNPVPLITQPLVPASVVPGSGGFTLTVNGAGFGPNAEVYWNGSIRSTTVLSGNTVQAQIAAEDVANKGTGWVTVANPAGVFSNVVYFPVRTSVQGLGLLETDFPIAVGGPVAVGDFNNDGKLDVAVGGDGGTFAVLLGTGHGTFGSPIVNTSKITGVSQIVTGDFNGDGNLDLAVQNGNEIGVYLGKGDGTFKLKRNFAGRKGILVLPSLTSMATESLTYIVPWARGANISTYTLAMEMEPSPTHTKGLYIVKVAFPQ